MAEMFNPKVVVVQLGISPGAIVADFGCGSGYFTLELAQAVGERGRVFAIDVVPEQLESVRSLAQLYNFNNIETRWANLEKTSTLEKGSCDWVITANLFFQIPQNLRGQIFKESYEVLKKGGKMAVIDWKKDSIIGPPKNERVEEEEMKKLAMEQKLKFLKKLDLSDTHWCLIFIK